VDLNVNGKERLILSSGHLTPEEMHLVTSGRKFSL
jgi:hypothetical protein